MSRLPEGVRRGVEAVLEDRGHGPLAGAHPVGGGCISRAVRLEARDGSAFFLKWQADAEAGAFAAEAAGLAALRSPGCLRVPAVVARDEDGGWLLLEFIRAGGADGAYGARLGRGLATLHRTGAAAAAAEGVEGAPGPGVWGWGADNFIGSLPQPNGPAPSWPDFWRDRRLAPQLRGARDRGFLGGRQGGVVDEVADRLDGALAPAEDDGPSLVHGDLWGGNAYADPSGHPVVIDPAVYQGHREVDLAMSELFGGFPPRFYEAYREAWPLADGYRETRRHVYQLYYLLVHVNLFGGGYVGRTVEAARRARATL